MNPEAVYGQDAAPSDFEREELQNLIDRSLEDIGTPPNADEILCAMIDVIHRYGMMMPPTSRAHLKKRIVLHSELNAQAPKKSDILSSALLSSMRDELDAFRGFAEDLNDMTEPWQLAYQDTVGKADNSSESPVE